MRDYTPPTCHHQSSRSTAITGGTVGREFKIEPLVQELDSRRANRLQHYTTSAMIDKTHISSAHLREPSSVDGHSINATQAFGAQDVNDVACIVLDDLVTKIDQAVAAEQRNGMSRDAACKAVNAHDSCVSAYMYYLYVTLTNVPANAKNCFVRLNLLVDPLAVSRAAEDKLAADPNLCFIDKPWDKVDSVIRAVVSRLSNRVLTRPQAYVYCSQEGVHPYLAWNAIEQQLTYDQGGFCLLHQRGAPRTGRGYQVVRRGSRAGKGRQRSRSRERKGSSRAEKDRQRSSSGDKDRGRDRDRR
jgi:hypothetical protein